MFSLFTTLLTVIRNFSWVSKAWSIVGPFVGKHKVKLIACLVVVAAGLGLYWYVGSLQSDVAHWKGEYDKKVTELAVSKERYETNLSTLQKAITLQNNETERVNGLLKSAEKQIDAKIKESAATQKRYEKQIQKILQDKKPKTCQGAIDYLIDGTGDLKW